MVDADRLAGGVEGGALAGGCKDDVGLAVGVGDVGEFLALEGRTEVQAGDVGGQAEGVGGGGAPDGDAGGRRGGGEEGRLEDGLRDHFEGVSGVERYN